MSDFPKMLTIRQRFPRPQVACVREAVDAEVRKGIASAGIGAGQTVAVACGSRGIANLAAIIEQTIQSLKAVGAEPFVFPAMGSHGGACEAGQRDVLAHYGITESALGVPVHTEMATAELGATPDGLPVYGDARACTADHIVFVNRVKPHTDFHGAIGSGIMKMMAIGFGKHLGANAGHRAAFEFGFERMITAVSEVVLARCPVAFGLALIENGYEETAHIEAVPAAAIIAREPELHAESWRLFPKLPVDKLDLLIIDWIGKNISGTGMDTNIVGRRMQTNEPELETPKITRIFVRNLTEESGGNGVGSGFADFTTQRFVDQYDPVMTYPNCIAGMGPQKVRIPFHLATDREVLDAAFKTIGMVEPSESRVIRIESTLVMSEMLVSEALVPELEERDDVELMGPVKPMAFGADGNLVD